MSIVCVRPPAGGMTVDQLFGDQSYKHYGDATHWMSPYRALARSASVEGIEFVSESSINLASAAALLLMEMPATPHEVTALRNKLPRLKVVLQITETPLGRAWVFDPVNHRTFDAVLTYNDRFRGKDGYFIYKLPAGGLESWVNEAPGLRWEQRKSACMVANAPNPAPWFPRRSGLGMVRSGWRFSPRSWWNYVREGGSIYRERLSVAQELAVMFPGEFDIYGPGWDGLRDTSARPAWRGPWRGSKLELLGGYKFNIAYENCINDCGYISEKIFDAFLAGSVPVYLGNQRIQEFVPSEAFVDARRFCSPHELGISLREMTRQQWDDMRKAGEKFLHSSAERQFGAGQYCKAVIDALQFALNHPRHPDSN